MSVTDIDPGERVYYVPNPPGMPDRYHRSRGCAGNDPVVRRYGVCAESEAEPCGNCMQEVDTT